MIEFIGKFALVFVAMTAVDWAGKALFDLVVFLFILAAFMWFLWLGRD